MSVHKPAGSTSTGSRAPIYVSSSLGFTVPGRIFYRNTLLPILAANQLLPLDPWDHSQQFILDAVGRKNLTFAPASAAEAAAIALAEQSLSHLNRASGVFAVLDGTDVDSGVAAEIGYASARGLPIVGWRSDVRRAGEPIANRISLQVEHFIAITGGRIFADLGPAIELLKSLTRSRRDRVIST